MDNGDDNLALLMMMLGGRTSRRQLTEADLETFRETLAVKLIRQMSNTSHMTLSVDYGPDRILSEAGDAIGLGQFDFPCKTVMWITESEVKVRAGYGAPEQIVWSSDVAFCQ